MQYRKRYRHINNDFKISHDKSTAHLKKAIQHFREGNEKNKRLANDYQPRTEDSRRFRSAASCPSAIED